MPANAQTNPRPGAPSAVEKGLLERPAQQRPPLPEYQQPTPTPGFVLPPVPPPSEEEAGNVPGAVRVFVREFRVTGNTVLSDAELAEITKPYANRTLTFEDLEAVRYALTVAYVQRGYVNSGAVIPDQAVAEGTITIQVIEGKLTDIEVEGSRWFRDRYIRNRLMLYAGPPLNVQELQQGLQLLQANPLVQRINAELRPGVARGEAVLKVRVEEAVPYTLGLAFNNYQSPSVGSERGIITAAHENLTGNGDTLMARYGITEGISDIGASYTLPVSARDTTVGLEFRRSDATVVEAPFDRLDITSTTDTYGLTLRHPIYRTLAEELATALTFEHRRSETFLLARRFSFSPGAEDGKSVVTVLRFSPEWTHRSASQVFAARFRFSEGLHALGATSNSGPVPDGQFVSWLGQFQWARRLRMWDAQVIGRADIQLTPDRLLSLEQFTVGGAQSVRGYRENQLVRDNGAVGSIELRIPVLWGVNGREVVRVAPFADIGAAWAAHGHTPDPPYLASVGLGARWAIWEGINLEVYWGHALKDVDTPGGDPQDHGVHFQVAADFRSPKGIVDALAPWRDTRPVVGR